MLHQLVLDFLTVSLRMVTYCFWFAAWVNHLVSVPMCNPWVGLYASSPPSTSAVQPVAFSAALSDLDTVRGGYLLLPASHAVVYAETNAVALRWTERSTAGQHSNPHHLPVRSKERCGKSFKCAVVILCFCWFLFLEFCFKFFIAVVFCVQGSVSKDYTCSCF